MLFSKKFYQYILLPFNTISFFAAVFFCVYGVNTVVNGAQAVNINADVDNEVHIEKIPTVKKNRFESKSITIQDELNPFAVDHKDWTVVKKSKVAENEESVPLNLSVNGTVRIGTRTKAIVKDQDDPRAGSFWITKGDLYKGYSVTYISSYHIILQKDGKSFQFSLEKGKGKIYEGNAQIFVAPDIDLYLEKLAAAEEKGADTKATKPLIIDAEDGAGESAGEIGEKNRKITGAGSSGTSAGTRSGSGGSSSAVSGSGSQSSEQDEMAFIRELMKIFGNKSE